MISDKRMLEIMVVVLVKLKKDDIPNILQDTEKSISKLQEEFGLTRKEAAEFLRLITGRFFNMKRSEITKILREPDGE